MDKVTWKKAVFIICYYHEASLVLLSGPLRERWLPRALDMGEREKRINLNLKITNLMIKRLKCHLNSIWKGIFGQTSFFMFNSHANLIIVWPFKLLISCSWLLKKYIFSQNYSLLKQFKFFSERPQIFAKSFWTTKLYFTFTFIWFL